MNIDKKIKMKMNRFINNEEKQKAMTFLESTIDEMVENENPSEQEIDRAINSFLKETNLKVKLFRRKLVQIIMLAVLIFGIIIFYVFLNPQWRFADESSKLTENGFIYEDQYYRKTTTKELTLTNEVIQVNPAFSENKPGDVVDVTYEFKVSLNSGNTGNYNNCSYNSFYNGQDLSDSVPYQSSFYHSMIHDTWTTNTLLNAEEQTTITDTCDEVIEFSSSTEPIQYK